MRIEINRDDLRCLILGKYLLSNEFSYDSNNAKHFLEGALFAVDFVDKSKAKEVEDFKQIELKELKEN